MSTVLSFFKPVPYPDEIQNSQEVKEKYAYWRIRIFYSMYFGYIFYYFTRKSLTFSMPFLISDLHFTKSDLGILASLLSIAYGISKFTSGVLCDRSNPRYFMAVGLILTGLCNFFFGFFSNIYMFALLWFLNGWFQGFGWPACTKQLTYWYSQKERGTWWSVFTTSQNLGGFLIAYIVVYSATWFGWRIAMFIPGIICIAAGLWLLNRLRDVPQSLGLPPIEKYKGELEESQVKIAQTRILTGNAQESDKKEQVLPIKKILFQQVLNNKYVWLFAISYFFVYIIRTGVNDWGSLFLIEVKNFTPIQATAAVSCFEIGGFIGMLLAGLGSDRLFQGKRVPIIVLFSIFLAFVLMGLWSLHSQDFLSASCLIGLIGFLVFGPQMMVGLAAAEAVDKKAASAANGFAGLFAYLGTTIADYPLMKVTEIFGWNTYVVSLITCALITTAILLPIWSLKSAARRQQPKVRTA